MAEHHNSGPNNKLVTNDEEKDEEQASWQQGTAEGEGGGDGRDGKLCGKGDVQGGLALNPNGNMARMLERK